MTLKINTIKKGFSKAGSIFWNKPLLVFLAVLLIYAAIGGGLFYWFYLKPLSEEPEFNFPSIQVNQGLLKEFVDAWQMRAEQFQQSQTKAQTDFFKVPTPPPPSPE